MNPSGLASALLLLVLFPGITGCASWFNPYRKPCDRCGDNRPALCTDGTFVDLPRAQQYADALRAQYNQGVGDQSKLTTSLGLALIPIGAAALGNGIAGTGGYSNLILGLTGATGLGMGAWLSNRPRQLTFIEGQRAITCAQKAIAPADLAPEDYRVLQRYVAGVEVEKPTANAPSPAPVATTETTLPQAIRELTRTSRTLTDQPQTGVCRLETKALTDEAARALAEARTTLDGGTSLLADYYAAGSRLIAAIRDIEAGVDRAIALGEPTLQSVGTIIGGLAGSYAMLVPTTTGLSPSGRDLQKELQQDEGEPAPIPTDACQEVRNAISTLQPINFRIASIVNRVRLQRADAGQLASCGVQEANTVIPIAFVPSATITLPKKAGSRTQVVVTGGKPPYSASAVGNAPSNLEITTPVQNGNYVVSVEVKGADLGDVKTVDVLVLDAAQHAGRLTVNVQ